ncbi:MAG: cobalamin biosynthesis protein [Candidatus Thermoplasmatota archaeon]|nr:cobalamin biosynthesis protein [Candidatus Thermoplasmatota archaeon]
MTLNSLEISLSVLVGSLLVDFLFGEPRSYIHPNVVIRKIGTYFDQFFRVWKNKAAAGFLYIVFLSALCLIPVLAVLRVLTFFSIIYVVAAIIVLKSTFSITVMGEDIRPIIRSLDDGSLDESRMYLSRLVRRDTSNLKESEVASTTIEYISKGIVDDVFTPLMFFAIFGVIGALFTRVVNVLDNLVGFKNRRNREFGKWTAITKTLVNYIPARIGSFIIFFSSELLNYRVQGVSSRKVAWMVESANNGWPIGAYSSALNLRIEKKGSYIINETGYEATSGDIKRALRIYYLSFYVFLIIFVIPVMVLLYLAHL